MDGVYYTVMDAFAGMGCRAWMGGSVGVGFHMGAWAWLLPDSRLQQQPCVVLSPCCWLDRGDCKHTHSG